MAWPAPNSYREAIQCPQICFRDPDLKAGLVVVDKQGLPAVSSGNYASVYSLSLPSGRIAIRCFNHRVPDQEQRYDEISRQLRLSSLPYTVDFRFVSEGIMVDGDWYPILRMEWVSGDPLLNYIETNLSQPEKLMALAQQWMQMARRLQRSCIAHGDLQHGNIIISNDAIKLIDYDGMYVPALDGLKSNERGHRNYDNIRTEERVLDHNSIIFPAGSFMARSLFWASIHHFGISWVSTMSFFCSRNLILSTPTHLQFLICSEGIPASSCVTSELN